MSTSLGGCTWAKGSSDGLDANGIFSISLLLRAIEARGDAATYMAMSKLLPNQEQLPSDMPYDGKSEKPDLV